MNNENGGPFVLAGPGWEKRPDGSGEHHFLVFCDSHIDFMLLPKSLEFGNVQVFKFAWDPERGVAEYRWPPVLLPLDVSEGSAATVRKPQE